ncbi:MAG TPA: DUF479 domain-containing protein [Chitinophagaceae bacterium]|nr:DUF479 domain-containing protein [Chitinophagaceae bacterium]HRF26297.1 ACP phosphodiesterase [Ferruginibacter sp.]
MNFLAHAYLSFQQPSLLVGNMISDFVKGKRQYEYPDAIQKGIRLHRAIDRFTDEHVSTASVKKYFREQYRLYSGAFADVVFDFFLANDTGRFSNDAHLLQFSEETYRQLNEQREFLPPVFDRMVTHMQKENWLYHYQYDWGIQRSFSGIVHRAAYLTESDEAFRIFLLHKDIFQQHYNDFFPELESFARTTADHLLNTR